MNEIGLNNLVEKLESVFLNILYLKPEERLVAPNINHLTDIKDILNQIFPENPCTMAIYTLNNDKQFFGITVNPAMTSSEALTILTTDEKMKLNKYQIEFDSKLFDFNLDAKELTAITLHEVASMVDSYEVIDTVRALIDLHVISNDDVINIRDSVNYSQLIIYAFPSSLL